ncbi:MAG TPA: penicillin-binding transpeptidase domain-containing protein, partial [Bacillales bacterium]|nr:penicillin-binding transpeptidase domain-containing protein [Bacillales bacterium]
MVGNEQEKQQKKKRNKVPFRLNILFVIVFLLFSVLILRLGIVQIVNGEEYQDKVEDIEEKVSRLDAARGLIYDRYGRVLVDNKAQNAITFTRTKDDDSQDLLTLAKKLSGYITMDQDAVDKVTERDKKDYWIIKRGFTQAYNLKLSKEELKQAEESENENAAYDLLLSRITEKDLNAIGKQEMQVVAIWRKLNQAMNLTPFIVKSGIKKEVYHRLGAHLDSLPGINLTVDSTRVYPKGHEFYLGSVGSIPRGKLEYYLVRGYNRNDEVGTSYLEQYYEDVLNGIPARMKYVKGNSENPLAEPERMEGRRGYDMVLTINIKLQHKVEQILRDVLRKGMSLPGNPYLDSAYAVVANPNTGGILALAGTEYENGEFHDDSLMTVKGAFAVGSNVKGATVLAGFETNTIPNGLSDKPFRKIGPGEISFSSY